MKLCKDCKYFIKNYGYSKCAIAETPVKTIRKKEPVFGKEQVITITKAFNPYCDAVRADAIYCGPKAVWFEKRKTFIDKILGLIK